jgi:CRP-like cAMP-binding protein
MSHFQNQLLAMLAPEDFDRLRPHLAVTDLEQGKMIAEPRQIIEQVFFPHSGIISYVVPLTDGAAIETGMVGRDGAAGAGEVLDGKLSINKVMVQVPGVASVMSADQLRAAADERPNIRKFLHKYAQFFLAQAQQTAACNASHPIAVRMCRWILRMHELAGPDLPITQEFLGQMLGVTRSSVSGIAVGLQERGLIKYKRGHITILKVDELHEAACECYGVVRSQYVEMFGVPPGDNQSIRLVKAPH